MLAKTTNNIAQNNTHSLVQDNIRCNCFQNNKVIERAPLESIEKANMPVFMKLTARNNSSNPLLSSGLLEQFHLKY